MKYQITHVVLGTLVDGPVPDPCLTRTKTSPSILQRIPAKVFAMKNTEVAGEWSQTVHDKIMNSEIDVARERAWEIEPPYSHWFINIRIERDQLVADVVTESLQVYLDVMQNPYQSLRARTLVQRHEKDRDMVVFMHITTFDYLPLTEQPAPLSM